MARRVTTLDGLGNPRTGEVIAEASPEPGYLVMRRDDTGEEVTCRGDLVAPVDEQ